jgi:hypothetical protein
MFPLTERTRETLKRVVDTRGLDFLVVSVRVDEAVVQAALRGEGVVELAAKKLEAWTKEFVELRAI